MSITMLANGSHTDTIPATTPNYAWGPTGLYNYHETVDLMGPASVFTLTGNTRLTAGSSLIVNEGTGPTLGPVINNGVLTVTGGSTFNCSSISGTGTIVVSGDSVIDPTSAPPTETIKLQSSHLDIENSGLTFLAPIVMDQSSTIQINHCYATREAFDTVHHNLELFQGNRMVDILHVSGVSALYATEVLPTTGSAYVTLSTNPAGAMAHTFYT